jgi:diguanylate cyclase (GGDEF)-like protein
VGNLTVRRRRFRLVTLVGAMLFLAAGWAAASFEPVAAPALVAAGVGFAAAGGGLPGLLLAIVGAGFAPLDAPLRVAFGVCALAVYDRASRREEEAERVTDQSFTDRLTGLRTYAFFTEALDLEVGRVRRYGGTCALIVFDLDRFKEFNDRYGHAAGNALLARVGATIKRLSRESDVAARFGGEEFVVLVPGTAAMAAGLAERVREAVGEIGVAAGSGRRAIGTTISAGVAEVSSSARNPEALFAAADAALYAAKHGGRNRVVVDGEADAAAARPRRAMAG